MTKINGRAITIPGFTVGLQQDTAIAPLGSFVSASNLVPLLGSRMGIRGGSRVVNTLHDDTTPTTDVYADTFTGTGGDAQALPAHTPTGSLEAFNWDTATYATCLDFLINQTTAPTNQALLPTSGWTTQSLRESVMTGELTLAKAAMDVVDQPMPTVEMELTCTVTIPAGLSNDHYTGLVLGCSATGASGLCVTIGFVQGRQRISVWSRDAAGVLTLIEQGAPVTPDLYTNDVPFAFGFRYTAAGALEYYLLGGWNTVVGGFTPPSLLYCGIFGARADNGDTLFPRIDAFAADLTTLPSNEVTHVPRIHPFSPVGMAAISYSAGEEKHYATRLTTDGEFFTGTESTSRTDLTASPSTSWDTTDPARPTCAELWEKLFLADGTVDYSDRSTFLSLDGTGTVLEPHFAFDGGSAQALRPYCLEEFNNVLFLAGYGDETVGDRPEMVRHSFLGKSPDAADGFDSAAWIMIGAKGQRVTAMCKGDTSLLVAKTNELYRISGYGRAYAGWQYEVEHIQQSLGLGCFGPYALCFAQGYWYGVGQNGPFRTDGVDVQPLRGPREHAWALVSSPEAFSVDYHPDRGLVLFSVRQATGLPEGLYLSDGVMTPPQETYPNVLWAWDLNRDVWTSDLGFNQQFFHVRAIPTTTTQSPQGTPTALAGTDMTTTGYTGNWTNGDATAETEYYERAGVAGSFALVGTAGDGDTLLARTGLTPHTRYYYYLQHLKGGIRSTPSATIEVLTEIAPPVLDVIPGNAGDPYSDTQLLITVTESGMGLLVEQSADGISGWSEYVDSPSFPAGTTSIVAFGPFYYRAFSYDPTWTPDFSDESNVVFAPVPS